VRTEIFIDGVSKGSATPCADTRVPSIMTFGQFLVGSFNGKLDDLVIASVVWTPQQVSVHFHG
jgi:hypothetical protein